MSTTVDSALVAAAPGLIGTVGAVAAAGLSVAVVKWGWPIGVQMFKSLIRK